MNAGDHSVGLVDRVIDTLVTDARNKPDLLPGRPSPMASGVLAEIAFPSGRTLSPSIRRWLEFDAGLLARTGWLASSKARALTPRRVDDIATAEWGTDWGGLYAPLAERFDECFLLPGGTDSRRMLATGEPDEYGEYPVFALDIDDLPFIGVMYPGFDVYLAATFGIIGPVLGGYDSLVNNPVYRERMRQHARNWFAGKTSAEYPWRT